MPGSSQSTTFPFHESRVSLGTKQAAPAPAAPRTQRTAKVRAILLRKRFAPRELPREFSYLKKFLAKASSSSLVIARMERPSPSRMTRSSQSRFGAAPAAGAAGSKEEGSLTTFSRKRLSAKPPPPTEPVSKGEMLAWIPPGTLVPQAEAIKPDSSSLENIEGRGNPSDSPNGE